MSIFNFVLSILSIGGLNQSRVQDLPDGMGAFDGTIIGL